MSTLEAGAVGFFGKLPGLGDFVQRRLPDDFVHLMDRHFQQAMLAASARWGGQWSAAWSASSIWRFMLPYGVAGRQAWAGVIGPSRDRVGRRFPLIMASPCHDDPAGARQVLHDGAWFDALASLHRSAQGELGLDAARFDRQVSALRGPRGAGVPTPPALDWAAGHWRLSGPAGPDRLWLEQAWQWLAARGQGWCLWWSEARGARPPGLLATKGLPADYGMLLDTDATARDGVAATLATAVPDPETTARPTTAVSAGLGSRLPRPSLAQHLDGGRMRLVCADEAGPEGRACAAIVAQARAHAGRGLASLGQALLDLHEPLQVGADAADGAVIAAQLQPGQARLWRMGAATAWLWRQGRLQRVFEEPPPLAGELGDLLFGPGGPSPAGLGAARPPRGELALCPLAGGDRLLLLASRALCGLPPPWLVGALGQGDASGTCRRIAGFAGLGGDSTAWPLTLIEVPA